jgi:hypothetical protein
MNEKPPAKEILPDFSDFSERAGCAVNGLSSSGAGDFAGGAR